MCLSGDNFLELFSQISNFNETINNFEHQILSVILRSQMIIEITL